jgi:hypothetical protein
MQNIMHQFTGNEVSFPYDIDSIFCPCFSLRNQILIPTKLPHDILYLYNFTFLYFSRLA